MITDKHKIIIFSLLMGILFCYVVIFNIPYGDDTQQYDTIYGGDHYRDPNGYYHISGLLDVSHCGSVYNHIMGKTKHNFIVNPSIYRKSFNDGQISVVYTCRNGEITNMRWGI